LTAFKRSCKFLTINSGNTKETGKMSKYIPQMSVGNGIGFGYIQEAGKRNLWVLVVNGQTQVLPPSKQSMSSALAAAQSELFWSKQH
jgi:hypothetical protein